MNAETKILPGTDVIVIPKLAIVAFSPPSASPANPHAGTLNSPSRRGRRGQGFWTMVNPPINSGPYPVTQEYLRSILSYDQASGVFIWLKPPWNHPRMIGQVAGCTSTGYVLIRIDHRKYKAHRLAWFIVHGEWPKRGIDHRDGDPLNNRISNLRPATQAQNGANAARMRGKVLPKGVRQNGSNRYSARISFENKLRTIGTYGTPEEAAAAYLAEAQRLYGVFARAA